MTSAARRAPGLRPPSGGTFTVVGGGADIWDTSDQFQFVYQPLQGDVEVIARVASLQHADALVEGRRDDPRDADWADREHVS